MDGHFHKKVTVVIPAWNEEDVIASVIQGVKKYVQTIVVVDDASSDQTAERARSAGADVLSHIINRGQGAALKTGIDYALLCGSDVIVTFDADGQHRPEEIERIVEPVVKGDVDVVLGSRFLGKNPLGIPFMRRTVLKGGIWFTRMISPIHITDTHNGFRAFSAKAARVIRIRQDRMAHASEIIDEIAYHKLRFCEVPVTVSYTNYSIKKGQSSLNFIEISVKFILGKLMH